MVTNKHVVTVYQCSGHFATGICSKAEVLSHTCLAEEQEWLPQSRAVPDSPED